MAYIEKPYEHPLRELDETSFKGIGSGRPLRVSIK
jgi:hypothetical protein